MTSTMRALQVRETDGPGPGDLNVTEIPVPEVGDHDVLVEIEATSVGFTVYRRIVQFLDDGQQLPRVPGHEIVGTVRETGDCVTEHDVGDRVVAYYYLSCDRCDACLAGNEPLCENLAGRVGVHVDGGFAEYACLPARNLLGLPDGLDPVDATIVPDAVATPYHVANSRAQVEPGDSVMVIGAGGGVGIHLVQVAQYFGGEVTAVDLDDRKLEECARLGAVETINTAEETFDWFDGSASTYDAVVDFTGSKELIESSIDALAPGGRLVNMTGFEGQTIDVETTGLVRGEREVVGSRYCSKHEFTEAAALVADGTIEPVISAVVDLDGLTDLFETLGTADLVGRGAVTP